MTTVAVIGCTHAGTFATTSILAEHPDWTVHVFERNGTLSFLSCGIALWVGDHVSDPKKMFYSSCRSGRSRRDHAYAHRRDVRGPRRQNPHLPRAGRGRRPRRTDPRFRQTGRDHRLAPGHPADPRHRQPACAAVQELGSRHRHQGKGENRQVGSGDRVGLYRRGNRRAVQRHRRQDHAGRRP